MAWERVSQSVSQTGALALFDAVDAADAATANRLPCVRVSNNVTGTCHVTARRF